MDLRTLFRRVGLALRFIAPLTLVLALPALAFVPLARSAGVVAPRARIGAARRVADAALVGDGPRNALAPRRQHDAGATRRPGSAGQRRAGAPALPPGGRGRAPLRARLLQRRGPDRLP